jgi:NADPH:quinone reductase
MRAVGFSRFGGPEVLEVVDLAVPEPGEGEVRIRVAAAALNPTDTVMREGARAAALEAFPPPWVPGMDAAGTVDAVGPGVDWPAGAEVMAAVMPVRPGGGAQAELIVVPADSVAAIPAGASLAEAATLPMNGLTVRLALDLLALAPGQTLGVTGAAGAVGGFAVELGRQLGLTVVADASEADRDLVAGMGADVVVARGPGAPAAMAAAADGGVDGLVDAALMGEAALAAIRDGGAMAVVRGYEGPTERGITIHPVRVVDYLQNRTALEELGRLAGEGRLSLRVAGSYPPEEAAEAHRRLAAGGTRGRLIIAF